MLISGRGSNMLALANAGRRPGSAFHVCAVLSDRPDAAGLAAAAALGIPTAAIRPRDFPHRDAFDRALAAAVAAHHPSLVALAGFMRILSPEFLGVFPGRVLNIHPSLLPKYPGLDPHRRVLEAGDAEHGATVHFVTEALDGGPPVVQGRVPVLPGDDAAALAHRVHSVEHRIYPMAVGWHAAGRLECRNQGAYLDGSLLAAPRQVRLDADGG